PAKSPRLGRCHFCRDRRADLSSIFLQPQDALGIMLNAGGKLETHLLCDLPQRRDLVYRGRVIALFWMQSRSAFAHQLVKAFAGWRFFGLCHQKFLQKRGRAASRWRDTTRGLSCRGKIPKPRGKISHPRRALRLAEPPISLVSPLGIRDRPALIGN